MKRLPILLLLLSGCAADTMLFSLIDVSDTDTETWEKVEAGAREWEVLDMYMDPEGEPVYIRVEPSLDGPAGLAYPSDRKIFINSLFPIRMKGTVTHELGHVLLDLGHLPPKLGVMSTPHHSDVLTVYDLEFACEEAERCY